MRNDDWMSNVQPPQFPNPPAIYPQYPEFVPCGMSKRLQVDKRNHTIRFEGETETHVIIAIEPKELERSGG